LLPGWAHTAAASSPAVITKVNRRVYRFDMVQRFDDVKQACNGMPPT
jgi:hypothetical protein